MTNKCGFFCKTKNSLKNQVALYQTKNREKKALGLGYSSVNDYREAVNKAREKGLKKAQTQKRSAFLKNVEKEEYLMEKGKGANTFINSIFKAYKAQPVKKRTVKKPAKYYISGGKAYRVASNATKKRKARKTKSRSPDDWLGNLGVKF